jgi:ABC-2 type transport system permease protein
MELMKNKLFSAQNKRRLSIGGYSVAAAILVLAIAVAINLFVSAIPSKYIKLDNTSDSLYTLSDQTENLVAKLDDEVTIYWIVQSGQEDSKLTTLLERYASLSDKLTIIKKDPDVYPSFAKSYTSGQIYNNSLVVENDQRYRYVSYADIYEYDYSNYYYTGSYTTSFAGESAITSAIDYVVKDSLPKIYTLSGHGESDLSSSYQSAISKANVETDSLSLLSVESVPEDCDLLLINTPQSDISEDELSKLQSYLEAGGHLLLITDPPISDKLENLEALMAGYGVTAVDGVVVEGDQNNYAWGAPYYLLPNIKSHTITEPLVSGGYYVLLPIAQGLSVSDELPDGVTVDELLTTSDSAYSKVAGYNITTYEKEDDDIDGAFALGVAITDSNSDSRIVWISSGGIVDDQTNSQVSGGNQDLFLNAISWMTEQEDSISIHAKTLSTEYLTISSSQASLLVTVMLVVLPVGCLAIGFVIWFKRRRR